MTDPSNGYDHIATQYLLTRNPAIGATTIRSWAQSLPPASSVLDLGCGNGYPVTKILLESNLHPYAIDASEKMITAFKTHFPNIPTECNTAENAQFFNRTFDGIIAIGLLFLLPAETQRTLIIKMSKALNPNGKILFTAPAQKVTWKDALTGQLSISLGAIEYRQLLQEQGLSTGTETTDEGGNYYFNYSKLDYKTHEKDPHSLFAIHAIHKPPHLL